MKPRMHRADPDAEYVGDLVEGQTTVVVQDHDGPLFDGEATEAALELLAVDHGSDLVSASRLTDPERRQVGHPATLPTSLVIAGMDEQSVRPRFETRRLAESREVLPDVEQCLLGGILRESGVAQDRARDVMQAIDRVSREFLESGSIPALGSDHEFGIHTLSCLSGAAIVRRLYRVWLTTRREVVHLRAAGRTWRGRRSQVARSPLTEGQPSIRDRTSSATPVGMAR